MTTTYDSDNFESFPTGWSVVVGNGGTITKSLVKAHAGTYSALVSSVASTSYAYASRYFTAITNNFHIQFWVYIVSTSPPVGINIFEPFDGNNFSFLTSLIYHNSAYYLSNGDSNGSHEDVGTMTPDAWHKIDAYYIRATGTVHYYIDEVKQGGNWTNYVTANSSPNAFYFGDVSGALVENNGLVYFDDWVIDNAGEVTAYTHTFAQLIGNLDTKGRLSKRYRVKSGIVGAKDTRIRLSKRYRSYLSKIGPKESISRLAKRFRVKLDKIGAKDSWVRGITERYRTFTDKIGVKDTRARLAKRYKVFSNKVGVKDSKSKFYGMVKIFLEYIGLDDTKVRLVERYRVFTNKIGVLNTKIITFHEFINHYVHVFAEYIGVLDSNLRIVDRFRIFTNKIGALDTHFTEWGTSVTQHFFKEFNEVLGVVDTSGRLKEMIRLFLQTIRVMDNKGTVKGSTLFRWLWKEHPRIQVLREDD